MDNPALSNFTVDLIDTEDWKYKFDEKDQKSDVVQKILKNLSSKNIIKRLNFDEKELEDYDILAPFSSIFFVVTFTLRKELKQDYSPAKMKFVVEHRFCAKYSYDYVPVILSHKSTVDSMDGIKETIFQISSFTEQKCEVNLLKQSLATVLNEYLLEWTLEMFKKGFGIAKESDTYRRHLILKCESGATGKITIARLLAFRLNFRNYISLERFPTEKRYFFRMSVIDTPMHMVILNSTEFIQFLSSDYRENACIIEITPDKCIPNKYKVKYHHLDLQEAIFLVTSSISSDCWFV